MRLQFVITLLLFIFLVSGAIWFWKPQRGGAVNREVSPEAIVQAQAVEPKVAEIAVPSPAFQPLPVAVAPGPPNRLTPGPSQEIVAAEVERLQELSLKNDAASLAHILVALTNATKEIREAAIEAAKQFGDPTAIPALKAAADSIDDLQEKMAFLEAADFLSIPSLEFNGPVVQATSGEIQLQAQLKAERDARRRVSLQQRLQAQNPQPQSEQDIPANPGN